MMDKYSHGWSRRGIGISPIEMKYKEEARATTYGGPDASTAEETIEVGRSHWSEGE